MKRNPKYVKMNSRRKKTVAKAKPKVKVSVKGKGKPTKKRAGWGHLQKRKLADKAFKQQLKQAYGLA